MFVKKTGGSIVRISLISRGKTNNYIHIANDPELRSIW